jgi:hypothetical protein
MRTASSLLALASAIAVVFVCTAGCVHEARLPSNPNPEAREGCWVDVFENDDFDGEHAHDRIDGPGEWPTMRNLPGAKKEDWGNAIDSVLVGPHARVHMWTEEAYSGTHHEFGPNTKVPKMSAHGASNKIESMKIVYVP